MAADSEYHLSARRIVARNMKLLRLAQGLSQEKLAARAGLHPNYLGSVERAERNISIDNLDKIAKALRVQVADLLKSGKGR